MTRLTRIKPATRTNARRLRCEMTDAERLLWGQLRQRQIAGLKFRRQHPLGSFIVDFVCIEAGLVIEVDGGQHGERQPADEARTAWLNSQGYRVLRFWNNEVLQNLDGVREAIWTELQGHGKGPPKTPDEKPVPPPGQGGG
jgi:very-short-patch-repair endonuclease